MSPASASDALQESSDCLAIEGHCRGYDLLPLLKSFNAIIHAVKKLLLIFLLAWLPLQFSWAAAAVYCQHEEQQATQHFGHHSHQHDASADLPDDTDKPAKVHADCGYCHLSCQASFLMAPPDVVVPNGWTYIALPSLSFSSHIPDGLQRPDWRFVA